MGNGLAQLAANTMLGRCLPHHCFIYLFIFFCSFVIYDMQMLLFFFRWRMNNLKFSLLCHGPLDSNRYGICGCKYAFQNDRSRDMVNGTPIEVYTLNVALMPSCSSDFSVMEAVELLNDHKCYSQQPKPKYLPNNSRRNKNKNSKF